MDICVGDSIEHRNLSDDINLCMDLDSGLCRSELCPLENRHTQVDGRRVNSVESSMQLKLPDQAFLLCNPHHVEGKLLKDSIIPDSIRFRKYLTVNGLTSKSKKERFVSMGSCDICKFSQTSASKKLAEHQNQQMVPMRKEPTFGSVVVSSDDAPELTLG